LGLDGEEVFSIEGIAAGVRPRMTVTVTGKRADGKTITFEGLARLDTPDEAEYYRHGGILQYVLRQLAEIR
jgi:aconitate hydratase